MKKTHFSSRLLSALLVVVMVVGMLPVTAFGIATTGNDIGVAKGDSIGDTGFRITSLKSYDVAPDIKEYTLITNNTSGTSQTVCNIMELTQGGSAKAVVGYGNVTTPGNWCFATTTEQCAVWEQATGENVVGGVNASWFDITTGEPIGAMVVNGTKVKDTNGWPYFATFSDGSATIVENMTIAEAEAAQSAKQGITVTMTGAVAAVGLMVKDGQLYNPAGNAGYYSRTCVGMKKDGTIVLFQADGTMAPRSVGYTAEEEAKMMIALGCDIVLQLDEGGSSTFVSQREGEDDVTMRNTPAGGDEREISTTILFVSTAKPDGEFHHANITPTNEYYTPNSTVALTASGIDSSGAEADSIPSNVTWALQDDSYGVVTAGELNGNTATATFVSNGTKGTAVVHLLSGNEVVGTAKIHIQDPDELYFSKSEVTLNYNERSDLNLVALYQNETVHLKDGDVAWSIQYDEGYDSANAPIGTMEGNIFVATSDTRVSCTATVSAVMGDLSAVTSVVLGKEPLILVDGGDDDGWDYSGISNTVTSFGGMAEDAVLNYFYNRGAVVQASVVDNTMEEYADVIRFGSKAIRIDYDWTHITGTDGSCLGLGSDMIITGAPTAFGVWVYVPDENTPIPWLRQQISTSTDGGANWTSAYVDFTSQIDGTASKDGKPLQVGWNYLEADISSYVSSNTMLRVNSGMMFRAMVTTAGIGWYTVDGRKLDQSALKSYILVDNISIVYGANNQDVTPPELSSLSFISTKDSSYTEIENGMVVTDNVLNFHASYHDNETTDLFATGVESAYFYFDGTYFGSGTRDNLGSTLLNIPFADGAHSVTFYLKDGYGNITRDTRYFTVDSGDSNELTAVSLRANGEPTVGQDWHLEIYSDDLTNVTAASAEVSVTAIYPVTAVNFPAGVTGSYTYNADKGIVKVTVDAVDASVVTGDVLADIVVSVPNSVKQGAVVYVSSTKGTYSLAQTPSYGAGVGQISTSFSTPTTSYSVNAAYLLTTDVLLVGDPGVIHVQTNGAAPAPAADVSVYWGETLLGTTDANGELTTDLLTQDVGSYDLCAVDAAGNRSYMVTVRSFNPGEMTDGAPYYVNFNISSNLSTQQTITWLSSPKFAEQAAQIRYSVNADLSGAVLTAGTSKVVTYSADNTSALANAVKLTGLTPNTTYYFQVGDGNTWSEVDTFTTASAAPDQTRFYVMADIQEDEALAGFSNIANHIAASGKDYSFAIQTGDAVDNVRYYGQWAAALELFTLDTLGDTDWIHVLGNHEVDDDGANGYAGKATFGLNSDWYSVEYGDVYVAVLHHTLDEASLNQFGAWLVADAAKTDCTWKIFATHVPVYYTNPVGGGEVYNRVLKTYIESAGIDFCFAGNDHSYARTTAMSNGTPDENGTVYYVCGSTGGKSYSLVDNKDFHFDVATIDFTSVYLDVVADAYSITLTAYDVATDGSVKVLDSYTKRTVDFCENDDHDFIYDRATDILKCKDCGYATTMSEELYSGFVSDKETGKKMYMVAGKATAGLLQLNDAYLYFDEDGLAYHGSYKICGETCYFVDGAYVACDNQNVVLAGMAGVKAEFVLYGNGRFVMSGSGATFKFAFRGSTPWRSLSTNIKSIEIGSEITELSAYTFYGATGCTSVTFGENSKLTTIGGSSFYYMSSLTEIVLPDSLTSIGNYAFGYCKKLTSVYLPDGVSSIYANAFNYCSSDLVLSVGYGSYAKDWAVTNGIAYVERPSAYIGKGTCGDNIEWTLTTEGVLTLTGSGAMYSYSGQKANVPWYNYRGSIKSIVIDANITELSAYSFYGATNCTSVSFGQNSKLTKIGGSAFYYNSALTELVLPDGVTSIGNYAFGYCKKLTSVYLPDGVSSIYANAFNYCNENLVLSVAHDSYAKTWAVTNGVAYVERGGSTTEPEEPEVPEQKCGDNITWTLSSDGVLTLTGSGAMYSYSGQKANVPWYNVRTTIKSIVIDPNITELSAYAFYGATNCTSVTFGENSKLTTIGGSSFYYMSSLTEIVLPDSLTSIGNYAFGYCKKLTSVYLPDGVSSIYANAFNYCNENLVLSVAHDSYAKTWAVTNGVAYVERGGSTTEPEEPEVPEQKCGDNITWTLSSDGVLTLTGSGAMYSYSGQKANVPWYNVRTSIKAIVIDANITELSAYAFYGATNCTSVTFGQNSKLTKIGGSAFYYNSALTELVLPEGVTSIGNYAFGYCKKLTSVYLPDGVSSIYANAFNYCNENLVLSVAHDSYAKTWAVTNGVAYVERGGSTTEPEEPEVPEQKCGDNITWTLSSDGVLTLTGSGAMYSYSGQKANVPWYNVRTSIKAIVIDANITELSAYAFYGATNCTSVTFGQNSKLTKIGGSAFYYNSALTELVLPDGVTSLGNYSFGYCKKLTSVYLPDGVSSIYANAFNYCNENLVLSVAHDSYAKNWAVTNGVAYVEREAKAAEAQVEETETVEVVEPEAEITTVDSGISGETTWTLTSDGLLKISGQGKMEDYSLEAPAPWQVYAEQILALEIDREVTEIGAYAFAGLAKLETVLFAEEAELLVIRDYAFANCEALVDLVLPEKLETLGEAAFAQCIALKTVEFSEAMKEIGLRLVELELEEGEEAPELVAVFDGCAELQIKAAEETYAYTYAQTNGLAIYVEPQELV